MPNVQHNLVFYQQSLVFKPKMFEMKQSPGHICSAADVEVSKIQTIVIKTIKVNTNSL